MTHQLSPDHEKMLVEGSGIARGILEERPYRSLTAREAATLLPTLRFSAVQSRLGSGLLFPLTLPEDPAPLYQFRPDRPRHDEDGKPIKYEIPLKATQRLIFHPRVMPALATGDMPVYITEGAKKLDALISRGAVAVGVIGVDSFAVKHTAEEKKRHAPKVLLPDWQRIALAGRPVVIVYDSDAALNPQVERAEQDLGTLLRAKGAQVTRVRLPTAADGSKQGVDDFFVHGHSLADVAARIEPLPRQRFATMSAPALYHKTLAPARWVIPGKLPVGATLFFGRGKDGKSLLVWNLAITTATGGKALGAYDVEQGDVLYLALEDGERRGQERLEEQMAHAGMTEPPARLDLVFWTAPRLGEGFLECLETWVDEHPEGRLIIIDILEKVRPVRTRDGVYADDYRALEALQQFGHQHNLAILIVHHSNKSKPEDFRDSVNGSMGLTGACDTLWSLQRVAGAPDATLKMIGREIEQQELALQFQDGFWTILGDAEDYRLSKESRDVLDALTQARRPLTPKQLATILGLPLGTIRARLKRMLARGEVLNYGEGYLPRSSPPPSSPPPEREREREQEGVTPVTPVTGVTPVTSVTLGQNNLDTASKSVTGALQRYTPVTGGGVTLFETLTPEKDETYSNGRASVTGVTPPVRQNDVSRDDLPYPRDKAEETGAALPETLGSAFLAGPDCLPPPCAHPETRTETMGDGSTLIRCTTCRYRQVVTPERRA
jgi:hypothetical protein